MQISRIYYDFWRQQSQIAPPDVNRKDTSTSTARRYHSLHDASKDNIGLRNDMTLFVFKAKFDATTRPPEAALFAECGGANLPHLRVRHSIDSRVSIPSIKVKTEHHIPFSTGSQHPAHPITSYSSSSSPPREQKQKCLGTTKLLEFLGPSTSLSLSPPKETVTVVHIGLHKAIRFPVGPSFWPWWDVVL